MKKLFKKLLNWLETELDKMLADCTGEIEDAKDYSGTATQEPEKQPAAETPAPEPAIPEMPNLMLASCWNGSNAQQRMMNMLAPKMPDETFNKYLNWMKDRKCNTAHVFLTNAGDGEYSGYDGRKESDAKKMLKRIEKLRAAGFFVVPWIMADDSTKLNKDIFSNTAAAAEALRKNGLLENAELIVLGLEMDEYGDTTNFQKLKNSIKNTGYKGEFGTHHTSGKTSFISLGSYVFDQMDPKKATADAVNKSVKKLIGKGKKVIGFEYSRNPNRELAQAAISAGAIGVGNW